MGQAVRVHRASLVLAHRAHQHPAHKSLLLGVGALQHQRLPRANRQALPRRKEHIAAVGADGADAVSFRPRPARHHTAWRDPNRAGVQLQHAATPYPRLNKRVTREQALWTGGMESAS